MSSGTGIFVKVYVCVTNWKEQGSNTGRVRGLFLLGPTQSQNESGKDECVLQRKKKA